MLMPTIFGRDFLDEVFEPRFNAAGYWKNDLMKTDVKEKDNGYELEIDLPGVAKEDLKAELSDGYLAITATTKKNEDEKDENGKYIRRERYSGTFSRSFYVGEGVTEEDIKAKFENGTLKLFVPKREALPQAEQKKYIAIEG